MIAKSWAYKIVDWDAGEEFEAVKGEGQHLLGPGYHWAGEGTCGGLWPLVFTIC